MRLLRVGDGPPPGRDRRGTMATGMGCHGARIPAPGLHLSLLLLAALLVLVVPGLAQPALAQSANQNAATSAPTAGLTQTSSTNLGSWIGSRLVQPKARPAKR